MVFIVSLNNTTDLVFRKQSFMYMCLWFVHLFETVDRQEITIHSVVPPNSYFKQDFLNWLYMKFQLSRS